MSVPGWPPGLGLISRGPESVSMDVTFVDSRHLYGLPEHTDSFVLANTEGKYINLFLT